MVEKVAAGTKGTKVTLKADDTSDTATRCFCFYDLTYNFSGAKDASYQLNYVGKVYNNEPCSIDFTAKK